MTKPWSTSRNSYASTDPGPRYPRRARRYRTADGWLLIGDGSSGVSYPYRFLICELGWDLGPVSQ
ncbi:hypothetical protein [Streptomyces sp. NPDC017988]|uniref:hypothetical protein n=1 Tax=Streptomyces sp. NPDC017988 TaxID=3365025 RepID=UPI0037B252AB